MWLKICSGSSRVTPGDDPVHAELPSQSLGESDGRTTRSVWSPLQVPCERPQHGHATGPCHKAMSQSHATEPLPCRAGAPGCERSRV